GSSTARTSRLGTTGWRRTARTMGGSSSTSSTELLTPLFARDGPLVRRTGACTRPSDQQPVRRETARARRRRDREAAGWRQQPGRKAAARTTGWRRRVGNAKTPDLRI